jgi:hypothetical protein
VSYPSKIVHPFLSHAMFQPHKQSGIYYRYPRARRKCTTNTFTGGVCWKPKHLWLLHQQLHLSARFSDLALTSISSSVLSFCSTRGLSLPVVARIAAAVKWKHLVKLRRGVRYTAGGHWKITLHCQPRIMLAPVRPPKDPKLVERPLYLF